MKVFRYMSKIEYDKYMNGEDLINNKNHEGTNNTSIGFCFMEGDIKKAEESIEFLMGIVNEEVLCVFEIDEKYLTKSQAKYASVIEKQGSMLEMLEKLYNGWNDFDIREEYCLTKYNNKIARLIESVEKYKQ